MYRLDESCDEEQKKKVKALEERIEETILQSRRIYMGDGFDNESVKELIRKFWYLEMKDPGKPILFVINSPGGSVDAGFALWDQIKMITSPVTTLVTGLAASMGSVLSLVAPQGRRFATENSRIMIHQPAIHGVIRGQATDLEIHAVEIEKTRQHLVNIYVEATGKPKSVIEKAIDRDRWFSAQEALEFGLINQIIYKYSEL